MYVIVKDFGFCRAYGICQVGEGLYLYLFDATKTQQQIVGGLGPDAGYFGERGTKCAFRTLVFVEGDGETVHLVLYLFQQVEDSVGGLELNHSYVFPFVVA